VSDEQEVYEMLWDCRYCDTKKLLGLTHRHCPGCGAPQDPEARYFPDEHEKVPAREHVYYGADVRCSACHEANSRRNAYCRGCGAPLANAPEVARVLEGQEPETPSKARLMAAPPEPRKSKGCGIWGFGCLTVFVVGLAGGLASVFWTEDASVEVVGHRWQRVIHIERYSPRETSSWCDSVPSHTRVTRRERDVRSHRKVPDGESCHTRRVDLGDGTYREHEECSQRYREEPVYDQRCYYMVMRWSEVRVAESEGSSLAPYPSWPAVGRLRSGNCEGCEREGRRDESYTLVLRDSKGKEHSCELGEAKWAKAQEGSSYRCKESVITGGLDCKSLEL
jgi:hypothetical protein